MGPDWRTQRKHLLYCVNSLSKRLPLVMPAPATPATRSVRFIPFGLPAMCRKKMPTKFNGGATSCHGGTLLLPSAGAAVQVTFRNARLPFGPHP
jgi:hypothetical protein